MNIETLPHYRERLTTHRDTIGLQSRDRDRRITAEPRKRC